MVVNDVLPNFWEIYICKKYLSCILIIAFINCGFDFKNAVLLGIAVCTWRD